jgi:chromosome segregation ATPase
MSARALAELEPAVSSDEFQALEAKVYKTVELLKSAREAKAIAERDVSRLRVQLEEREEEVETLREQMVNLRREREEVRGRVEKMLKQMDVIELEAAQA